MFEWIAQSGRPGIVAPDRGEAAPATKLQPEVVPLARAWRWQRLLDNGFYSSVSEIGDTENISRSYVSGILRLTLLAPGIVERIVDRRSTAALARLLKPFPLQWERQRKLLAECCR